MKPNLILMSHGQMAVEMLKSAQMITGVIDDAYVIAMMEDDGISGTKEKLEEVLKEIGDNKDVLIIADLYGGTPCNVASMFAAVYDNIQVLSGLNINMVIEYAFSTIKDNKLLASNLKQIGIEAVQHIIIELNDEEEDEI